MKKIQVKTVGNDAHTAYVSLPGHASEPGVVKKTINLAEIIEGYKGPIVHLDFDKNGKLVGIEILASSQ